MNALLKSQVVSVPNKTNLAVLEDNATAVPATKLTKNSPDEIFKVTSLNKTALHTNILQIK